MSLKEYLQGQVLFACFLTHSLEHGEIPSKFFFRFGSTTEEDADIMHFSGKRIIKSIQVPAAPFRKRQHCSQPIIKLFTVFHRC